MENGCFAQTVSENPSVLFNTSQIQWKTKPRQAVDYGKWAITIAPEDLWLNHADDCML